MFKTTSPDIKNLIWDLVVMSDELSTVNGKKFPRTTYPKKHFRPSISIKKKIAQQVIITYTTKDSTEEKQCMLDVWEGVQREGAKFVTQAHSESEIEFTDKEVETLKAFHKERDELLIVPVEDLDVFEKAIGVSGEKL